MKTLPIMLVISSNSTIQNFFTVNFHTHFSIFQFDSPKEAFDSAKLLDVKFVMIDGKEHESSLSSIRKYFPSKNTRIFVISNEIRKSFLEKALQAGVDDFLQVPLLKEEIEEKMFLVPRKQTIQSKVEEIQRKSIEKGGKKQPSSPRLFTYPKEAPPEGSLRFPGCVLYIQVDNFEEITINEDPSSVEKFSDEISSFLSLQLRTFDKILLYSSEVFILFLGDTHEKEALLIAQNLQRGVAKQHFSAVKSGATVSMVVASIAEKPEKPLEEIKKILEKAKAALETKGSSPSSLLSL
ncbi:MAG: diguanylate cyclase [Chlamydiae bacterium]|jgi:PleD family two-component response regulator|nr:diguanylate cyclase [Chlamydiota bacterium]